MGNAITDFGCSLLAGLAVGIGSVPTDFYVALCTDEPGTGWDGTMLETIEPTDISYARKVLASGSSGWTLSPNGYVLNAVGLDFGVPAAPWGVINHFALCDAITDGNLIYFGEYAVPANATTAYDIQIQPGGIVIALANLVASIAAG